MNAKYEAALSEEVRTFLNRASSLTINLLILPSHHASTGKINISLFLKYSNKYLNK